MTQTELNYYLLYSTTAAPLPIILNSYYTAPLASVITNLCKMFIKLIIVCPIISLKTMGDPAGLCLKTRKSM